MMSLRLSPSQPQRRLTSFGRCRRDQRGMAAVEFALVLPFLLLLFLGSVELTRGIQVDRQVALTADTVTNLVAQYTTISKSQQMPDILNASVQIFTPYPSSPATVVVSLIGIDGTGKATVTWSQTLNGTARTAGQVLTLPAGLDIPNTNLVFGEVTYAYTPWVDFMNIGTLNFTASLYMSPRAATTINLVA
jgi:Flp pilus assembly protein TadG